MKFKLVENINLQEGNIINEGYSDLWKQFSQLCGLEGFDLHHIYEPTTSKHKRQINYLVLPRSIHRRFPKYKNQEDAIILFNKLNSIYPNYFKKHTVSFILFDPPNTAEIVTALEKINIERKKNNKRKKNKVDSEIIYDKLDNLLSKEGESDNEN